MFIASFRIGDGPLLDALYEAVRRLRGGVYVVTSWDAEALRKGIARLGDDEELTEDEIKLQNKRFDDMTRRGIAVRGHPSCHAKFLVIDDAVALVTSANLETSALRDTPGRRSVTGESGAILTDAREAERLARFFTRLWYEGCTGEAAALAEIGVELRPDGLTHVKAAIADNRHGALFSANFDLNH